MPAAAKIEKPIASGEITNGKGKVASNISNGTTHVNISTTMLQEPPKIVNTIIEKKIRNLEKRKVRLLEIKALEDKGQQLEADQKNAVKKLDNVMEMIDMLKEIGKNVTDGLNDHAKQVKKLQKKEQMEKQAERQQQDLMRVKLLLNMHFVLSRFSVAKNDLLQGENGAIKLDENQVESLESLSSVLSPQSFDLIEQSAEKINYLLEGHKREFVSGLSYSDLKESLIKLIESNYFENLSNSDKIVENTSSDSIQDDKPAEENHVPVESVQNDSEVIAEEQTETKQPIQNSVHQMSLSNQLCFMRDPVVENELQHKDPAVVAVASSGFTFPPQIGPLSTSSGSNIITSNSISSHYPPNIYPIQSSVSIPIQGSIPTQTFTNPSYNYGNGYIPVSMAGPISHQMIPEQHIPIRNIATDAPANVQNNVNELANEKNDQFVPEPIQNEASNLQASQDADGKPITNGQVENGYYKRNNRGRGGNSRGNFVGNPNYRGRGAKNFGYFNGGNNGNVSNSQNGNFNSNRPVNRQNGGGNRSGYRQDRGVPRNQTNYNQQSAPVSAK